ncbi:hypothetical protein AQJ11_02820 [Streptomyces corchorusii]|uniref:Uncharacterized protein n=2 Tax=Streptomyces TaxID=1883 RepID=A0A117QJY5_STRCK|nr:hypothetical protein [Streptomyces corchorusii]KUN32474.1 hypothetical protein AQJ11_02820 [Streptomyces corchorusii]
MQQFQTPDVTREFLRLCLDPGPGREKRTPVRLLEVLPQQMHDAVIRHAPYLRAMRDRVDALAEQHQAAKHEYADALTAWIHGEEPKPVDERYVIGRDGVFATLYDRQEQRLVVENATEEYCRQVRDALLATQGRPCVKCSALAPDHIAWAKGHLYVEPDEPQPAPAPARRSMPLLEVAAAAHDAAVTHAAKCGTCWPGMRLAEMCEDGQRAALAVLEPPEAAPQCAHVAWEVTHEYRNGLGTWTKLRKCSDCGERLPSIVELEPHLAENAGEQR